MGTRSAARYVGAGVVGAIVGAVALAIATRAVPKMMSGSMAGMMRRMMEEGGCSEQMKACMERCGCAGADSGGGPASSSPEDGAAD